jgi:hypothetical protein
LTIKEQVGSILWDNLPETAHPDPIDLSLLSDRILSLTWLYDLPYPLSLIVVYHHRDEKGLLEV